MGKYKSPLFALIIGLIFVTVAIYMKDTNLYGDEVIHFQTINDFTNFTISESTFSRDAKLPGYPMLIAFLRRLFSAESLFETRIINIILSAFCVFIFYAISKLIDYKNSRIKTVQFFLFPLNFVFFFLLYTDIFSLLLLLSSFYLIQKKEYALSGILASTSILIRQNNVIWALFLFILIIKENRKEISSIIGKTWTYIIGFLSFASFVLINRGTTIGEMNKIYQSPSIHVENVFFFLLLFSPLFLPAILANYKLVLSSLKEKKWLATIAVLFLVYLFAFKSDHPWNNILFDYFLRNELLRFINQNLITKALFFIPIPISLIYLLKIKDRLKLKLPFLIFTVIFLTLSWLVDPRYYIIPFSFILLMKTEESKKIEFITVIIYLFTSIFIFIGTINRSFFI